MCMEGTKLPSTYLCRIWAGSDVDRVHNWEENILF